MSTKQSNIIDISLAPEKQKIRIDGDDSRIIELDTTDVTILHRLQEAYPRLNQLGVHGFEADDNSGDITPEALESLTSSLNAIDKEMRYIIDFIFGGAIADVCVPIGTGAMYNMRNGEFVFERILDELFTLYADHIQAEYGKVSDRMKQHTAKYTQVEK